MGFGIGAYRRDCRHGIAVYLSDRRYLRTAHLQSIFRFAFAINLCWQPSKKPEPKPLDIELVDVGIQTEEIVRILISSSKTVSLGKSYCHSCQCAVFLDGNYRTRTHRV